MTRSKTPFWRVVCCFALWSPLVTPVWSQEASGPVVYEKKGQFTISLPTGSTADDLVDFSQPGCRTSRGKNAIVVSDECMTLFFLAPDIRAAEKHSGNKSVRPWAKVNTGEIPSFRLNRQEADRGMSCAGLPEKSHRGIVKMVERRGGKPVGKFQVEPMQVGGCAGLQIRGTRVNNSIEMQLEVRAVSDGKTLYLFALDQRKEFFEKNRHFYEQSLGSLRMAAATPTAQ